MAKELNFSKIGNLYISDPVEYKGNLTCQLGFLLDNAWVKTETSISSEEGWSVYSVENAPKLPHLFSKSISDLTDGMFVRFSSNHLPKAGLYIASTNTSSGGSSSGSSNPEWDNEHTDPTTGLKRDVVENLESITSPSEDIIYLVANGNEGENKYDEYLFIEGSFERLGTSDNKSSEIIVETIQNDTQVIEGVKTAVTESIVNETATDEDIEKLFK